MFCKYCGTQIDDDSAFCQKCGKKLESSTEPVSIPENQDKEQKEVISEKIEEQKEETESKIEQLLKEDNAQDESNYCRYCGTELRIGARFCTSCGKSQIDENQNSSSNTTSAEPEQKTSQATSQSNKDYNILCVIGFIIALLPLVFSGLIFSIIGLILSYIGLKEAERSGERGTGLAKAGVVISTILLIVSVIALISGIGLTAGLLTFAQNLDYYY